MSFRFGFAPSCPNRESCDMLCRLSCLTGDRYFKHGFGFVPLTRIALCLRVIVADPRQKCFCSKSRTFSLLGISNLVSPVVLLGDAFYRDFSCILVPQ